jgi:hypothetical protein
VVTRRSGAEGLGELYQQRTPGAGDAVVDPFSAPLALEQVGAAEDLEVAGGGGLGQCEDVGEFTNAEWLIEKKTEEPPTGLIGKGMSEGDEVSHRVLS